MDLDFLNTGLLQKVLGVESIQFLKMVGNKRIYFRDYVFVFSILWQKSGQPICFFYKIEPKRMETKKDSQSYFFQFCRDTTKHFVDPV